MVGLPGDRVEIKKQRLIVNKKAAYYSRLEEQPSELLRGQARMVVLNEKIFNHDHSVIISAVDEDKSFGPYIVPPNSFFSLGDNREFSEDSRHWGAVPYSLIESKVWLVWLSIQWTPQDGGGFSSDMRWRRILSPVH